MDMGKKAEMAFDNFDENNLDEVRAVVEREKMEGPRIDRAYTMIQRNSPCKVSVSKSSRELCVAALLK